jgi:hypothetical protein
MKTMYDSVNPNAIPTLAAGDMVAYYVDGKKSAWPASALADSRWDGHEMVSITVVGGTTVADVVDCEKGDVTDTQAAAWWQWMGQQGHMPTIYCAKGRADGVVTECRKLISDAKPQLWIADWTNLPHMVTIDNAVVVAVQWTSDTGADYDESLVGDWILGKTVTVAELTGTVTTVATEPTTEPVSAAGKIISTVSRQTGGDGWVVFEDGSVWTVGAAPFYGSYPALPAAQREAPAVFVGAVWGDGKGNDGYTLIDDTWDGTSDAGLYRFGPTVTTK